MGIHCVCILQKAAYPRYFTAWSLEEVVLLMIQYIVLGLELDLYAPSEYGTVYWCDVACLARKASYHC
jgi:hypothetical protein